MGLGTYLTMQDRPSLLPQQDRMTTDIEAPPAQDIVITFPASEGSDFGGDMDEDDGCLLDSFTLATGFCSIGMTSILHKMSECGNYFRDRRFWLCKIVIAIMDMAILKGAMSMAEESCQQDDEISSFGWVLWSSFLVVCKFVYLKPVFHLHQLGVFHGSAADARKSALLEFICFSCHIAMFASFAWHAVEPGFIVYVSGGCAAHSKTFVDGPGMCGKAGAWLQMNTAHPSAPALPGSNRSTPISDQPPGCYYTLDGSLFFNPLICSMDEAWCSDWVARTYGTCSRLAPCICQCSFLSAALVLSIFIFFVPMPLQWRMLESSCRRGGLRFRRRAAQPSDPQAPPGSGTAAGDEHEADNGGQRVQQEGAAATHAQGDWPESVNAEVYARVMDEHKFGEFDEIHNVSVYKEADGHGAERGLGGKRLQRLHRELKALPGQLLQHPSSSTWIRYSSDMPQFMRAAITGPQGTPYEGGIFLFDLFCPESYPEVPPKVTFLTTARGTIRFNPNLYPDGKVCLSLLGTFDGPRWGPASSIYQVLMSIQGMILGVAHPIFNEPGLGGFEAGAEEGFVSVGRGAHVSATAVQQYDERTQLATLKHAVIAHLKSPPQGFEQPTWRHFAMKKGQILATAQRWLREARQFRETHGSEGLSGEFVRRMEQTLKELKHEFGKLRDVPEMIQVDQDAGAAGPGGGDPVRHDEITDHRTVPAEGESEEAAESKAQSQENDGEHALDDHEAENDRASLLSPAARGRSHAQVTAEHGVSPAAKTKKTPSQKEVAKAASRKAARTSEQGLSQAAKTKKSSKYEAAEASSPVAKASSPAAKSKRLPRSEAAKPSSPAGKSASRGEDEELENNVDMEQGFESHDDKNLDRVSLLNPAAQR